MKCWIATVISYCTNDYLKKESFLIIIYKTGQLNYVDSQTWAKQQGNSVLATATL